jgi:hypothetical protein
MVFPKILFKLFELFCLLDDVTGIIPLSRSELAIDEGTFILKLIGVLLTGIKEGWLESLNLYLKFCLPDAKVNHLFNDFGWLESRCGHNLLSIGLYWVVQRRFPCQRVSNAHKTIFLRFAVPLGSMLGEIVMFRESNVKDHMQSGDHQE